ncbi:hypothetical protein P9222_07325 [Paenibacillus amylolyticus]|nr:hypothetical protein [Paenibacillus amylolyticus]WFR64012.1 hypothetical protein P9222_07325 [Paenibacillus amylolyticus]
MACSSLTRFLSGPFIFFTIIMMIKSSLAWIVIFDDIPVWKPLLTELPLIWIGFCLIEWVATKRRMWMYLTMNLLLSGIFFAAIMYYKYYGVIVNYHALAQVNQVTSVKSSMFTLLDPYYLFIFADVLIIGGYSFVVGSSWGVQNDRIAFRLNDVPEDGLLRSF